jgi:predicted signal transduction protein with EAL and GGDEF domain
MSSSQPASSISLAEKIIEAAGHPHNIEGHEATVGASVGIAIGRAGDVNTEMLLKSADLAMYSAKSDGRGTYRIFDPEMDAVVQSRRTLERDMRTALVQGEFTLFYQPLVNMQTKKVTAFEALLRWNHPERGLVSPSDFIPVAEEMGLIVEIGKQVLRKACTECRAWPGDTRVAVNLSPIQFSRANVPFLIRDALAATGLPAGRLEIEITETTLLQDTTKTRDYLRQLDELGVKISLDDFGTGYSSLSYLHSFPLHKVKIDQSFLKELDVDTRRLTLLRGIARLSAELGLRVAVEGVETYEQLELISAEDSVDEVQGYLFSMALPGPAIRQLLRAFPTPFEQVA